MTFRMIAARALVAAAALATFAPPTAEAAVVLSQDGVAPIGDTDGVRGLADIDTLDFTTLNLSLVYREIDGDLSGGGILGGGPNNWGARFIIDDEEELLRESVQVVFSDVVESSQVVAIGPGGDPFNTVVRLFWQNADTLADGAIVARIALRTLDVGFRPDDDLADLTLRGGLGPSGLKVFDPIAIGRCPEPWACHTNEPAV